MKRRIELVVFLAAFAAPWHAQDLLQLDEAVKMALEKNYQVQVSRNFLEVAKAQNNAGNAGMSPTVSLNGSITGANLNSYQVFSNGTDQDRRGAVNFGTAASLNADWTVFDGMRMFAVKKRLMLSQEASELELRQQMENTVFDVMSTYFGLVRTNELLKAAKSNLRLYEERRKIAQVRLDVGSDSRVELLLSQADESRARTAIVQLELDALNAKTALNIALARPEDTDFRVTDTITLNYNPSLEELKKDLPARNSTLLIARKNELIAERSVAEARAANLPFVTVSGAYVYTRNQSQAGFINLNRQSGFNGGITARWLIFNGGRNNRLVKERNLLALNQRLLTSEALLRVNGQAYVSYQRLLMNRNIAEMELQSLRDARELQSISLERYRIGKSGVLETIETQKNLEDVQVRYINALYNARLAEMELLRANGELVK
jgi:outer membrane protein